MKNMKKWLVILVLVVVAVTLTACSGGSKDAGSGTKTEPAAAAPAAGGNALVDTYGFQWTDPNAPILNAEGAC